MAGIDDLFAEFLGPGFVPTKPQQIAVAAEQKKIDLAGGYQQGATASVDLPTETLTPEFLANPGSQEENFAINRGRSNYIQDASRQRSNTETTLDAPIDLINGVFQGALGIGAAGAGMLDADAGAAVSGFANDVNEFATGLQSDALNGQRRAHAARNEVTTAHNEELYRQDIANGQSNLIALLKREGRNFIDGMTNSDSMTFGSGTFNGVGSLLLGGVLGKGLRALGVAERAAMPGAIAALEGGGAYQSAVQEVMGMSHDALLAGSPEYVDLLRQGIGPDEAKSRIANDAGLMAGLIQAPVGALTGSLVSKFEASPFRVPSLGSAAGNILREGIEEGIQSGSGEFASNLGIRESADNRRDLSQGVGAAAGEGALYGMGTAGAVQGPGIPVRATISTGKAIGNAAKSAFLKGKDALVAAGEAWEARTAEQSPVSRTVLDAAMTQVSQDAANPDIQTQLQEALVAKTEDPEEQQAALDHIERVLNAIQIDAPTEAAQQINPRVRETLAEASDRFDALRRVSALASDTELDPRDRLEAGLYIVDTLTKYQGLFERDLPNAILKTDDEDPILQPLREFEDVIVNIQSHPELVKTVAAAFELSKQLKAEDINTTEDAITAAKAIEAFPQTATLEVAEKVLMHDEGLPPEKRTNLELTIARLKIEQELKDRAASLRLNSETVAKEVLTDPDDRKNKTPSAAAHFNRVMEAVNQRNIPLAQARMARFMKFAEHMNNKVAAYNENYRQGTASKDKGTYFQQLMPNGVFRKSQVPLWINPRTPGSVANAQMVEANARAVVALANRLAASLPDLGVQPITEARLDDGLQGPVKEVNDRHRSEQARADRAQPEGTPQPDPDASAEATPATDALPAVEVTEDASPDEVSSFVDRYLSGEGRDDPAMLQFLINNGPAVEAEFARRRQATEAETEAETVEAEEPEATPPSTPEAPEAAPETEPEVEQVAEPAQENELEEAPAEIQEVEESSTVSTPVETFSGLYEVPGKIKNWFWEAFRLPAQPRSRLPGMTGIAQTMYDALASHDSFAKFVGSNVRGTLKPEVAQGYSHLFTLFNPVEDEMNARVAAYLSKDPRRLAALVEGNDDESKQITSWLAARVLNLVQESDGKFAYHPELIESAILAGMSWMVTAEQRRRELDEEDVAKITDTSVGRVTEPMLEFFNTGVWGAQAKLDLAQKIKQYWGVDTNKDAPMGYTQGLAEAMAVEVLAGFKKTGLIDFRTSDRIAGKTYTQVAFTPDEKTQVALKLMRQFPDALDQLVLVEPEPTHHIGTPPSRVAKFQMRNKLVKTTPQQRQMLERVQKMPSTVNETNFTLFEHLGIDGLKTLFGGGPVHAKMNINHRKSIEGKNRTIELAFDKLTGFMAEVRNHAETIGKPVGEVEIFHEYGISKVGRLHMIGGVNPQADKLVREVVLPTKATIDLTDPQASDLFFLALGQHLGIKVHKQVRAKTVAQTQAKIALLQPAVDVLSDWIDDPAPLGPEAISTLQQAFTAADADLTPGSIHALVDYVRSTKASPDQLNRFETRLYIEADGVTDGPINAMMHMASDGFSPQWIETMQKGGLFLGGDVVGMSFNRYAELDPVDLYETVSKDFWVFLNRDNNLTDKPGHALAVLLGKTLKDFDYDSERNTITIRRGITKNPVTVSIYGSSDNGIAGKVAGEVMDSIYELLSEGPLPVDMAQALKDLLGSRIDFSKTVPTNFTFDGSQIRLLEDYLLDRFVLPMRLAITQTIGETDQATTDMRDAVQVQSIFLVHQFQKGIDQALDAKEQQAKKNGTVWKRSDFLSENELAKVYDDLKHLSPFVDTITQSFMMMARQKAQLSDKLSSFGRGLQDELNAPGLIEGPGYAGVKGIPTMIIGPGDGQMIQNFFAELKGPDGLPVFDGFNFALDKILDGSRTINQAVRDGWLAGNPFMAVTKSFGEFLDNADFSDMSPEMMQQLLRSLIAPEERKSTQLGNVQQVLNEMRQRMEENALIIQARHNVLSRVKGLTVDHMATAEAPYIQDDGDIELTGTPAEMADQLNDHLAVEVARLTRNSSELRTTPTSQNIAAEIAEMGELDETTGARVITLDELNRWMPKLAIPQNQKSLIADILKGLDPDWQIIAGSQETVTKHRRANGLFEIPFDPKKRTNGIAVPKDRRVYIIAANSEVLAHELIHAATLDTVTAFYDNPASLSHEQREAVRRIEQLANQWLKEDHTIALHQAGLSSHAYRNARRSVNDHLAAGRKAQALNEFMTWNLSNQDLIDLGKRTPVLRKLAQLTKQVVQGIIRLVWGEAKAPHVGQDLYSNLRFNTEVLIMSAPSIQAQLGQVAAFHSTEFGNNDRLTQLRKGFARKAAQWIRSQPAVLRTEAKATFEEAIARAQEVTREFDSAFPMSMQESSTFRMIVATLATEAKLNPNALARIQEFYRHVTDTVTVESFMADPDSNDPNDRYHAQNQLNTLLGHHLSGRDRSNRSFLMPSFLALAMVSDQFRHVLGKLPVPRAARNSDKTLDALLENFGNERMDNLARIAAGEGARRKHDVEAALDVLTEKLIEETSAQQQFIEANLSKVESGISSLNDKLVQLSSDLAHQGTLKLDQISQETDSKLVKGLAEAGKMVTSLLNETDASIIQQGLVEVANKANGFRELSEVVWEMVGRTGSNATIFDMIKRVRTAIQQGRQQFREQLPKLIASKFSRKLDDAEYQAMFHGLAKTDLAALFGSFSMVRLMRLIEQPNLVAREIRDLEQHLSGEPHWSLWQTKAQELAAYMNGGRPSGYLLRNAHAIAHLYGQMPERLRRSTVNPTAAQIKAIDRLVSLYALQGLDQETKNSLSSLAQTEGEGLQFVMSFLIGQRRDEMSKIAPGSLAEINHYKGHVITENDNGSSLLVASDEEFTRLTALGYTKIADYQGSPAEHGSISRSYYFAPVSGRSPYSQGVMQNVRVVASGVDPHTGYTVHGTAGVIENPEKVARIARRLQANGANGEALLPVHGPDGSIIAFERSLDPVHNQRLDLNTHMGEVLGIWRGRQVEELRSQDFNQLLIDNLHQMWQQEKADKNDQYVNLFSKEAQKDPVLKDSVALFTAEARNMIAGTFPPGEFWVRKDLVNNVVGYRNPSVSDAWTGISRWNPEVQRQARAIATAVFKDTAFTKLVKAERLYQTFVSDARVTVVVKSVIVPMANIMSNVIHLVGRGVPIASVAKGFTKKAAEVDAYIKGRFEQIRLEGELRAAQGRNDIIGVKRIKAQIQSIVDAQQRMTIWPLIEAGEFASISDTGISHEEIQLTEGRLSAYVEQLTSKLPPELRTLARYGIVARDTALFKGLQRAVEYGDFLAKATLYDDLTIRQKKSKEYALGRVTEEFINYDYLPGRSRTALENMGVTWFWNFKLRAVKIALATIRNNPLNLLLASLIPMPDFLGSVGTPVSDNIVTIGLEGDLGWSTGIDQGLHAHTLNPWVNLSGTIF